MKNNERTRSGRFGRCSSTATAAALILYVRLLPSAGQQQHPIPSALIQQLSEHPLFGSTILFWVLFVVHLFIHSIEDGVYSSQSPHATPPAVGGDVPNVFQGHAGWNVASHAPACENPGSHRKRELLCAVLLDVAPNVHPFVLVMAYFSPLNFLSLFY